MKQSGNLCKRIFFRMLFKQQFLPLPNGRGRKVLRCTCSLNIHLLNNHYVPYIFLGAKDIKASKLKKKKSPALRLLVLENLSLVIDKSLI